MAFIAGFNFRQTVGFVTDGGDEVFADSTDTYPTTKTTGNGQSVDFGWEVSLGPSQGRDRDSAIDARLAGMNFEGSGDLQTFRVDLEATGDHDIRAAYGDAGDSSNYADFRYRDDTTVLFDSGVNTTLEDQFRDATDVLRTSVSDWVNNNAKRTEDFASTIFRADFNVGGARAGAAVIAHLFVEEVAVGGLPIPVVMNSYRQRHQSAV